MSKSTTTATAARTECIEPTGLRLYRGSQLTVYGEDQDLAVNLQKAGFANAGHGDFNVLITLDIDGQGDNEVIVGGSQVSARERIDQAIECLTVVRNTLDRLLAGVR